MEFNHNLLLEMHINKSIEKYAEGKAWSLIIHKNTIKNCSTVLQAFFSWSLYLYPLLSF